MVFAAPSTRPMLNNAIREPERVSGFEHSDSMSAQTARIESALGPAGHRVNQRTSPRMVGLWSYNGPAIWAVRDAGKIGKSRSVRSTRR